MRATTSWLYVAVAEARHPVVRRLWTGHVLPLHVGSPGKVLLAHDPTAREALGDRLERFTDTTVTDPDALGRELEGIRSDGYATSFGEWEDGVAGIAAPVLAGDGRIVAALAISAPAQRLRRQDVRRLAPVVVESAREASARLGHSVDGGAPTTSPSSACRAPIPATGSRSTPTC